MKLLNRRSKRRKARIGRRSMSQPSNIYRTDELVATMQDRRFRRSILGWMRWKNFSKTRINCLSPLLWTQSNVIETKNKEKSSNIVRRVVGGIENLYIRDSDYDWLLLWLWHKTVQWLLKNMYLGWIQAEYVSSRLSPFFNQFPEWFGQTFIQTTPRCCHGW